MVPVMIKASSFVFMLVQTGKLKIMFVKLLPYYVEHKILWIKVVGYYDSFGRCNDPYYHHTPLPDRTNEERTRQSKDTSLRAVTLTSQCLQLS